nr:hypothetical protein [Tanacetum cinerariifolium]
MASAIICLANNQKFNFSKQVKGMAKHKEIYVISSHTKKIFANMRRQGHGFSRNITPLFKTMMKKIKPKRKQRQAAEVHSPSSEIPVEQSILTPSNDPLPSEEAKSAQAKEIAKLKKRVKKLEKRRKSRPAGLRRIKKERSIEDIDQDAEIALVDESQGRMHDAYMFGVMTFKVMRVARKLEAKMRAVMEEEERIAKEKDNANRVVTEE